MAWEGSVTDRGMASAVYEASADIAAFTGNADSLILLLVATSGQTLAASDISGHEDGGAWVEVASVIGVTETRWLYLFAAHEGSSPSNEALIANVDDSYMTKLSIRAFEITDVKVDGTVAESFGTPGTDEGYPVDGGSLSLSVASAANAEGLTLVLGVSFSQPGVHTVAGYTVDDEGVADYTLSYSYISGEDTAQDIGMTLYTQHVAAMIEVVGVAAATGTTILVPTGPLR